MPEAGSAVNESDGAATVPSTPRIGANAPPRPALSRLDPTSVARSVRVALTCALLMTCPDWNGTPGLGSVMVPEELRGIESPISRYCRPLPLRQAARLGYGARR